MNKNLRFIVGLGNPGKKYENTPHNAGRNLVDLIASERNSRWKKEKWFERTEDSPALVKLSAFMNSSGEALVKLVERESAKPSELLVCCDDFDLPLGTIRIRKKGSAGSHNGLKSVMEHLETQEFPRLRLGIGPAPENQDPAEFVLEPFPKILQEKFSRMLKRAAKAIEVISSENLEFAMNEFNRVDS